MGIGGYRSTKKEASDRRVGQGRLGKGRKGRLSNRRRTRSIRSRVSILVQPYTTEELIKTAKLATSFPICVCLTQLLDDLPDKLLLIFHV